MPHDAGGRERLSRADPTGDEPLTAPANHRTFATGRGKLLGHLAMVAFAAFVAGSFSLGALAAPHLGPSALNAARFLLGITLVGVSAVMLAGPLRMPDAPWRFGVLGLLMSIFFITMFWALQFTSPVATGAVFTLMPIASAFFGWLFLGQIPRGIVILSLLIAGVGSVWVIFRGDLDALASFDLGIGEIVFFFGVLCHAAYAPLVRRLNRGEPVIVFTFWTLLATGLMIAMFGAREILATDWSALPPFVWVSILYLSVFTTAGTFFLLQFASMRLPASKTLAYGYLNPILIILYEGLLGHGWATWSIAAGAVVTVLGLAVMALARD